MSELHNPQFGKIGYIQVYTGDGKGKTTASLGLALRALGRGWNVLIIMFTKGGHNYGELESFANLSQDLKKHFKIVNAGSDRIVYSNNITDLDRQEAQRGWKCAKEAIEKDEFQLVILDEINIALDLGLIDLEDVLQTIKNKPQDMEIVLTGRRANEKIIEAAHLVSEIKPVKHYWDIGATAREGIEY
ncbi:cob(I)alamin adenosyltransferase [Candidatus Gastranaerophilus sp. (ex Termes propinquus)]|nr:cob(I)alamin adenosyltransferase [Candidatus Gastranaerophilus sp. (ex Termes propinquus)]